ncbi:hypothetical protein HaLaN_15579, partial [Haematococcus lacustris]
MPQLVDPDVLLGAPSTLGSCVAGLQHLLAKYKTSAAELDKLPHLALPGCTCSSCGRSCGLLAFVKSSTHIRCFECRGAGYGRLTLTLEARQLGALRWGLR